MDLIDLNIALAAHGLEARDMTEHLPRVQPPISPELAKMAVGPIHIGRWEHERRKHHEIPGCRDAFSGIVRLWRLVTDGRTPKEAHRRFCRMRNLRPAEEVAA